MKTLACKDTGADCDWVGRAETENELLQKTTQHVKEVHKMDWTPEMDQAARKVIHSE